MRKPIKSDESGHRGFESVAKVMCSEAVRGCESFVEAVRMSIKAVTVWNVIEAMKVSIEVTRAYRGCECFTVEAIRSQQGLSCRGEVCLTNYVNGLIVKSDNPWRSDNFCLIINQLSE